MLRMCFLFREASYTKKALEVMQSFSFICCHLLAGQIILESNQITFEKYTCLMTGVAISFPPRIYVLSHWQTAVGFSDILHNTVHLLTKTEDHVQEYEVLLICFLVDGIFP